MIVGIEEAFLRSVNADRDAALKGLRRRGFEFKRLREGTIYTLESQEKAFLDMLGPEPEKAVELGITVKGSRWEMRSSSRLAKRKIDTMTFSRNEDINWWHVYEILCKLQGQRVIS